jgi:(S)-3,5-dihydroxyphenylglycine transaminase
MIELSAASLHSSLAGPALRSISFLNEIMSRFPKAISFAPGAPHLVFLRNLDITGHVDRYLDYLCRVRGYRPDRARQLLCEYGPSQGLINDLVAEALRRDHAIDVPPDAIVITVGAQEAMFLALRVLLRTGRDLLAVVDPSYAGITGAARLLDIDTVPIDEGSAGIDIAQLTRACREAHAAGRRVRALYVAPDFANPAGTTMDLATRRRLLNVADREGFLILEDNAYGFTAAPGTELPPLKALDRTGRVIHLGTFAKVCLPGARVGFVVADQRVRTPEGGVGLLAEHIATAKSVVTVNTSPICQAVIGGMLLAHGGSLAELGRSKAVLYRRNLGLLLKALDRHLSPERGGPAWLRWNRPAGGFFVRMFLPVPADETLLELSASKYGVLWTPMAQFHLNGSGTNALRLSCSYLDPEQIETGVGLLAKFLHREVGP